MSPNDRTESGMLSRYLYEQHSIVEALTAADATDKTKYCRHAEGKLDQAVKILDKEMHAITDPKILKDARKAQQGLKHSGKCFEDVETFTDFDAGRASPKGLKGASTAGIPGRHRPDTDGVGRRMRSN